MQREPVTKHPTFGPADFTPHGLVLTWQLEGPYKEAKRLIDPRTQQPGKEYYTVSYFEDLFRKVIFNQPDHDRNDFSINSQLSAVPTPAPEKACDIVVKHFDPVLGRSVLCFVECKRSKNTTPSLLADLEEQARGYCIDYLSANPKVWHAFACTTVGVSIRCWFMVRENNVLQPFWDWEKPYAANFASYLDTGLDENAQQILGIFQTMERVIRSGNKEPPPRIPDTSLGPGLRESRESSPTDVDDIRVKLHKDKRGIARKRSIFWFEIPGKGRINTEEKEWKWGKKLVGGAWVTVKLYVSPTSGKRAYTTDIDLFF